MKFSRYFARRITFFGTRTFTRMAVALAVISISLAVAVMEVALSIAHGFESEIQSKVIGFFSDIQIGAYFPAADDTLRPLSVEVPYINDIKKNYATIASISPFIQRYAILKSETMIEGIELKGIDKSWNSIFFKDCLIKGRLPNLPDTGYGQEILISRKLADLFEANVNDKLRIYFLQRGKVRLRVVSVCGIYETGLVEFDQSIVFCDMKLLQRILGWAPDKVQGFDLRLKEEYSLANARARPLSFLYTLFHAEHPNDPARLVAQVNKKVPYDQRAFLIDELYPDLFQWLSLQHQNVLFIIILMMLVAIVNMSSAILILITERTSTVGLLKALGANNYNVQKIFLWNALYLILYGCLFGNLLGLGLLFLQDQTHFIVLNPESYFVKTAPVAWIWDKFLFVNLSVVVVCTLSMLLPTLFVLNIKPAKALKT